MRTSRPAHGSRPTARRWLGSIVIALVLAILTAGPAAAATVDEVAAALRQDPVYWEAGAEDTHRAARAARGRGRHAHLRRDPP